MATIVDVRYATTDASLLKENLFAFEIETAERVYALGCETAAEKVDANLNLSSYFPFG